MVDAVPLTQVRDSFVNEAQPSKNYSSVSRLKVDAAGSNQKYSYIYFPKNFPLGVDILSGKLRLYNDKLWSGTVTLSIKLLAEKWAASRVNWNKKPATTGTTISIQKSNAAAGTLWEFDIKTWLQAISDGGSWYGIRISVDGTTTRALHSAQSDVGELRPVVLVSYSDKPEPPENLSPAGNRAVPTGKPILTYQFIDVAGDVTLASHQFQINPTNDFTSPQFDTGWIAAEGPSLDLTTTAYAGMNNLQGVYWRVRVRDGAGSESDWSSPAQMRREDKGTLTGGTLGTKVAATNLLTSPEPPVAGSSNWTGLNTDGSMSAAIARSPNIVAPNNQQVTALAHIRNNNSASVTVQVSGESSAGSSTVVPTSVVIPAGTEAEIRWLGNVSPTATGVKLKAEVTSGFVAGKVVIQQGLIVFGDYQDEFFSGASVDSGVVGPFIHAWTGAANASTSTRTVLYIKDSSPPVIWALTGKTQESYSVTIANVDNLEDPLLETGKITDTINSVTSSKAVIKKTADTYRLTIRVWDTVAREKNGDNDIFYEYVREFKYLPDDVVTKPVLTEVTRVFPWPWLELHFTIPTPPDSFSIIRDDEVVRDKLSPGDLWEGGPTYVYRDRRAAPRIDHTWSVVANVNNEDSKPSNKVTGSSDPGMTWLMDENGKRPIAIVKSSPRPDTPIEAQARTSQEVHQPVGGSNPVLITQYLSGFEGSVQGVLSDDIVAGLTARQMRDRFKYFRDYPGETLLLYMVDEVLEIVAYNMTYRPRSKAGKRIIYDVAFDFFEVHDRGKDFVS